MEKIIELKNKFKDKKVAVIGIGVSNIPAIRYLLKLGAKVSAFDSKKSSLSEVNEINNLDVDVYLGENAFSELIGFDYILRSPGIKPSIKEIGDAVLNGALLTSEIELLIEYCPCKIIAVTGSDGKTTTTSLIYEILKESGIRTWVGGNIGTPLFDKVEEMKKEDVLVLELSSFQLMTFNGRIHRAVITNLSENHLDYHKDFEEYVWAKTNIYKNQRDTDILILNQSDKVSGKIKNELLQNKKPNIREFSIIDKVDRGVYLENNCIVSNIDGTTKNISNISDIKLLGMYNVENICACICAVIDLVKIEDIYKVITAFKGVEHRLEFVKEVGGVKWYNDSIATSPTRTIASLSAFNEKIILIAGGYDKNISYDSIGKCILDKVKVLILMGDTKDKIRESVLEELKKREIDNKECLEIVEFETLDDCVNYAKNNAKTTDIVVLSPASASFGLYENYTQRGKHFKQLVLNKCLGLTLVEK